MQICGFQIVAICPTSLSMIKAYQQCFKCEQKKGSLVKEPNTLIDCEV